MKNSFIPFKMLFAFIILLVMFIGCSEEENVTKEEEIEVPGCERSAGVLMDFTGHFTLDDQDNIWFTRNNKFYTLSPDGIETEIAGTGQSSLEDGAFQSAKFLTWHPDGYLLFLDEAGSTNSWLRKVTPEGSITNVFKRIVEGISVSSSGKVLFISAGGDSPLGRIWELKDDNSSELIHQQNETIYGISFDSNDDFYFATFSAVYKLNDDETTTLITGHTTEQGDVQSTLTESRYSWIRNIATAPDGVFYITDISLNKIFRVAGNEVQQFANKESDNIELPFAVHVSSNGSQIYVRLGSGSIYRFTCQ